MRGHCSRRRMVAGTASALLLLALWLVPAMVAAQNPATGSLRGMVTDEAGAPLAGAFVTLRDVGAGVVIAATSDRNGAFRFGFLPPGEYDLGVERIGFSPWQVTAIPVLPGRELGMRVRLAVLDGAVRVSRGRFDGAALSGGRPGASQWHPELLVRALPHYLRDVSDLVRLSSTATDQLSVEGLAPWLSSYAVDGIPYRPAAHPGQRAALHPIAPFALSGVGPARLLSNAVDVEWGGVAGAFLDVHSHRGAGRLAVAARADWSGAALPGPSFVTAGAPDHNDLRASLAIRGGLGEGGRISAGADVRRLQTPVAPRWAAGDEAAAVGTEAAAAGVDVAPYTRSGVSPSEAAAAFLRVDLPVARRHQLMATAQVASLLAVPGTDAITGHASPLEGRDILAAMQAVTVLGDATDNDLRVVFASSTRQDGERGVVPHTTVVDGGLAFGASQVPVHGEETRVLVSDAVHHRAGAHHLKFGVSAEFGAYRYENREGAAGEFLFGGPAQLAARSGVFQRTEAEATGARWSTPAVALFAQDQWYARPGLSLLFGVRADRAPLPSDVALAAEWLRLTGVPNNPGTDPGWLPAVRFGLDWDVATANRWFVHAGGGIYHDRFDPLLLSQWQVDDGSVRVRREVGAVAWPAPPAGGGTLPRLTVLGPGFEPPRTARFTAGVSTRVAAGTAVSLAGVFRRTDNLPRRADLNLLPLPVARDQYGRAVYGTLLKQGGLLVAEPGSNRRFESFDEVAGITAEAWSEHWGVTAGLEHDAGRGLAGFARYTWGRTTDNWFGAREGGWTVPAPRGLDDDERWVEGTSDFDVPHRAVLGISYAAPLGVQLAGLYRLQSGMPFTPGFRAGVDASGDGSHRNDPAFIDPALPGMAELMSAWPCLQAGAGAFAPRNACRGAMSHALDLSATVRVLRLGAAGAALVVEVFDVLDRGSPVPDAALYLVDPAAALERDLAARTIAVPLLVNPDFGNDAPWPRTGRRVRLGFSLNW
jgi:hypothetical protein